MPARTIITWLATTNGAPKRPDEAKNRGEPMNGEREIDASDDE